ncbi:uncharacterized protein LOC141504206 [Macrotis lagotis]|uniref:uncharacterized protein LOC141504206 n=1 Tax=Macrotis lagotis TaxID=92651 RepID=UPI003D69E46A
MFLRKMQLPLYLLLLVTWIPKAIFCQEKSDPEEHSPHANYELAYHKIKTANTEFAGRLFKLLVSENPHKNVFFSPLSIATAFAMLSLGAKTATLTNLLEGLGFNLTELQEREIHKGFQALVHLLNTTEGKVELESGNGLFIDDQLKPLQEFLDDVKNLYEAEVFEANFRDSEGSMKLINDYVNKKTHGKIPELIQELDSSTSMILINYNFFKGDWETSFNANLTELQNFYVDKNTIVEVQMMMKRERLYYSREDKLFSSMVVLPYEGNAWLILILPDEDKLEQALDAIISEGGIKCSRFTERRKVELYLPRISISTSYDLEELLPKIGIKDVFTDNADLTGISTQHNLQVSKVLHKAVLEVNETGTVAAAVTSIAIHRNISPPIIIRFDRPFIMYLANTHIHQAMFIGKIVDPTLSGDGSGGSSSGSDNGDGDGSGAERHPLEMEPVCMWMLVAGLVAVIHCQPHIDCEGNNETGIYLQDERQSETYLPCHKISNGNTIFALHLYKELTSEAPNENIFFSPVSISMALAMLSLRTQAKVRTQILEGLGFNLTEIPESEIYKGFQHLIYKLNLNSKKHELKVGSFMILDKHLKLLHEWHSIKEWDKTTTFTFNFTNFFSTRRDINKYIENQTYGKIREFLQDFNQNTIMVLVNYIFFKAKWMNPFKHYWIKKHLSSSVDEVIRPSMMQQKAQHRFLYDKELACIVLQMEYIENVLILLILPDEGKMRQVEDSLNPGTLKKWNKLLLPSLLNLHLPKFSISGEYNLEETLPRMGFSSIFTPEVNLSNTTEQPHLAVSKLLHRVAVDINEKGTKAAATSTFLSQPETPSTSPPTSPPTVHFDRPFLLLIWEVSAQSLLFLGKIITPTAS